MKEKKIFVGENSKEKFKELCIVVYPQIQGIMRAVKNSGVETMSDVTMGEDGYLRFTIQGSPWEMTKLGGEYPAVIRYSYSEEIEAPVDRGMEYGKVAENLVEISLMFAKLQAEHKELYEIDSITWKKKFVEWANEFERLHPSAGWLDVVAYLDEIEIFARNQILAYAHSGNWWEGAEK